MISYYYAVTIKSPTCQKVTNNFNKYKYYKKVPFLRKSTIQNNKICDEGLCKGRFKPLRAHHCKICNKCTLKMDHHCPWVLNCVGVYSHKSFYLTQIYWSVFFFLNKSN